jgi:hypothetical protein
LCLDVSAIKICDLVPQVAAGKAHNNNPVEEHNPNNLAHLQRDALQLDYLDILVQQAPALRALCTPAPNPKALSHLQLNALELV